MALKDRVQSIQQRQADQNTGIGGDVVDLVQKGAIDALGGVAKFVGADQTAESLGRWSEEQMQTLTPEMKQSMAKRFINDDLSLGEGVKDWRSWVGQGAVLAGQMLPSLTPAGAATKGAQALGAGAKLASGAGTLTSMATNAAIAGGMQGQQVEDEIMNLSYDDLKESDQFRQLAIEYNQQGLPPEEVLLRAKQDLATRATDQVMQDPTLIGVNAMAGMVGDKAMGKLITGRFGQTIRGNVAKGVVSEGGTESFQGGYGQYVSNVAQGDAGLEVDAMEGVVAAALEEGLIAGGLGGAAGGVGGSFQKLTKKQEAREQIEPIIQGQVEQLTATGFDRETAVLEIERMAKEAAIRMGNDAETAQEIATEAVAASTGQGPSIQEQQANILQRVQEQQAAREQERGTRGLAETAYNVSGRTGRMQQAAQTARADNVPYQAPAPSFEPRQTTIDDMYDEAANVMDDTGVEREDALTPQEIINMRAMEAEDLAAEGQAERQQADIQQQQDYLREGRLPAGYEPTEAARRIREEQGVDLREQYAAEEAARGREPTAAQPTTETPEQARQRIRGQVVADTMDQRQREAGLEQMEADQAAWDETGEAETIEAATATPDQPQTSRMEQDVVQPQRQPTEPARPSELTPQQQVDLYRGQTTGQLRGQLGQRQATGASPRLAKKKTARLNRKLNAIFERISQANPTTTPETQTFGYQANQAMADAFAALQPTTGQPTPDQFNQRVDQLVEDGQITESEASQVKEALEIPRSRQPRRTTKPMTDTGVPVDEVAGDYQSVSPVADQQWQPEPEAEEEYDVEADLGPDFEEDYGMAEPEPEPEVKVFEGATYAPQSRIGDTEWQESGGWSNEGATPIPDRWKNVSDTKEYVVTKELGGRSYSIWSRPKETTGKTMESGKEYDWDDDVIRFSEESGRVQIRGQNESKWRNMKFNWMDKFTEETGVTIPDEYREAHRQPRRDKKEVKQEVVEPTQEEFEATEAAKAKEEKKATDKAKRLERERQKDVIGEYNGIDNALAAMERLGVMETHYPHKLRAGPAKKVKFEVRKLPEKVDGTFKIHGWSTDTMSGFYVEGVDARALKPFAMLVGRGQNAMVQNAPSAIDWKDIKGLGLKTINSPDFLRMVIERGGKFDSQDSAITDMLNEIEKKPEVIERTPELESKMEDFERSEAKTKLLQRATSEIVKRQSRTDLKSSSEQIDLDKLRDEIRDTESVTPEQAADFDKRIDEIIGKPISAEIEAQAKAKTDKTMASAKTGEFMSKFRRLRAGEIKPDAVIRGASSAPNPRKAAFEWLYKEINNADPQNQVITGVGLGSNGKPFKSETGARNQGKGQGASAVVPASSIVDGEEGFVWVKYRDTTPDGDGSKGKATEIVASDSPTATPPKGAIKSATSMVSDIANQLYVPGLLPEHAPLKVDSFFTTMDYTNYMASLPAYQNRKENVDAWKAQNRQLRNLTDQKDEIIIALANKAQSELDKQEQSDVPRTIGDLERDTGQDAVDQEPSESERRKLIRERDREVDEAVEQGRTRRRRDPSIPAVGPLDAGTSNTDHVDQPDGQPSAETGVTGSVDARGNAVSSGTGVSVADSAIEAEISRQAEDRALTRPEQQKEADKVAVKLNNAKNIDKTLPLLSPEQRTDVVAAEKRLYGDKKKGMMFTNGTGTGKTYTGSGVIKRVIRNGGKVLVVAPAGTIKGWQGAAKDLQFDMVKLDDKKSGLGDNEAVITSYQNFSDNQTLLQDKFDLVVYDEAHKIMANMQGDSTKATAYHYAVTGKDGKSRGSLVYRPEIDELNADMKAYQEAQKKKGKEISDQDLHQLPRFTKRRNAILKKMDKLDKQFEKLEKKAPTKALFLSASPFSGHKSVFYADGYLFDTDEGFKQGGYNSGSPQQQYLMKNFGYRMRYNKANQPGAEVDVGLLERDWADEMFKSGAMVGRTLNLSQDYSRQFPQVDQGVGAKIDALFTAVTKDNKYPELSKALYDWRKNGKDRQLAEALRIAGSLDRIEEHLKLGRKVVVFHQRMEMTITDPFAGPLTADGMKELRAFNKEFPELRTMSFVGLESAPKQIIDHFGPDRVGLFNGQVTKTRNKDLKEFNKDGGSKDILVIQKDAGKEGLSAHDITGNHQRALIITNTPQSPADAIQMEGRIYRFGLQSNAIIEYPTVQTNFEKIAFRDVVSNRTATAENLAMGSQARMLRTAFRDGYTEPYLQMPNNDQGVGGKNSDRTVGETSQLDRAKTYYYKKAKKTQQTKAAEGADYFATPEPIGLSMVNMAGLLPGESALEPSAGHGAIAHWFPESVTATAIEQSPDLIGDLSMFTDADVRHQDFEALNIVNKYDGVVMNPPFGKGGHLAIQHIDKATKHLNNGGRVVAIYPMGGLADKRFDKWYEEVSNVYLTADIKLPGVTFKRAGTGVMTRILVLDKDTSGKPAGGSQLNIDYSNIQDANELFDKIHELEVPKRPDVQVNASDIGMIYIESDKSFIAELSGLSGSGKPAKMIGKNELRKIADRYYGEVRTNQGYWDDTHYAFDTEKDRQRFAKAVLDTYNKQFKREKTPEVKFKDSDEIRFSKVSIDEPATSVPLASGTMTDQEVQSLVVDFLKDYRGNVPLTFRVQDNILRSRPDLPEKYRDTKGWYRPATNRIEIYAENAVRDVSSTTSADLKRTLRHELFGHFGLNTFSPADKKALLGKVLATRGNPKFADLWRDVDKAYEGQPSSIKAEEVFALAAEIEPSKLGRVWTGIVDHFQRLLQKVGLIDRPLTRTQLQATINRIDKGLKDGTIEQNTFPETDSDQFRQQSTEDVEAIANDFIAQYQGLSNVNVVVVPNQDALSEITNTPIEAGTTVKGAYMPGSDTIVMVADNLTSAEDARRVLRHELIAHKGLMDSLSQSDVNLLTKQVMSLTKAKALADIWRTVEKSYTNAPDAIKAEEVIARIAEEPRGSIGQVADQVISWVMGAMRRTGLLSRDKVTLSEVRNMLNNVDKNLRTNSGKLVAKDRSLALFSQERTATALSVEEALNAKENAFLNNLKKTASRFGWDSIKENWMGALTLRQLTELKDKVMGGRLSKYLDTVNQMLVVQNTLAEQVAERVDKVQKWATKNRKAADELFTVMHNATLANVDPSAKFESMSEILREEKLEAEKRTKVLVGATDSYSQKTRNSLLNRIKEIDKELKNEPFRRQEHMRMKREFDKLTPEAQQHFKDMRDHYAEQRGRMQQTLLDNIDKAKVNDQAKAVMLRQLRFDMERAKKGLYFPLSRFGKYWVDVADKASGERYFMMYETQAEMESAKRKLVNSGYEDGKDLTSGQKLEESRAMDGASMGFINDVVNELQTANVHQKVRDELTDTIYQLYLQSMPERSIRKNFIHRKGVAGFNQDAIRAMADQGVKQSRQQARLQFVDELEEQMTDIRSFAEKSRNVDITRTANEMTKRHEWVKNPSRSPAAQKLTSLGFYWMLGASPASALVNLTQTAQIGIGVLGSRHGNIKSAAAVGAATKDFTSALSSAWKNKGKKGVIYYGLSGHERQALEYGMDIGALDTTQAADLMGLAENPSATYNGRIDGVLKKVGFMFHYAEIMNREVTYMAAYRMEYAKNGGNAKAAQDYAVKATWDSHFDYGSLNRARFMQGDLAAVALQFKQYSQSMTYFLASNAFKSIKGASPEERRTARRQLTWTLGSTFLVAGAAALPLMSVVMGAINTANDMFGDDDEPWDAETEFKAMLTEYFGEDLSKQFWYGAAPSISGRISLNDLWIRDPNRDLDPEQWGTNLLTQAAGPTIGGIGFQFLRGLKDISEGNVLRGTEGMLPKAIKDVLRTYRYIDEGGITNRSGDFIAEDLSSLEIAGQILGFTPGRSVYRYDQNSAMKGYELQVTKRRSSLMSAYYMAWRNRDSEAMRNIQKKIRTFNRSKWGRANPITSKGIKQSIKRRQKNLMRSDKGLLVSPKLERLINESAYWS